MQYANNLKIKTYRNKSFNRLHEVLYGGNAYDVKRIHTLGPGCERKRSSCELLGTGTWI